MKKVFLTIATIMMLAVSAAASVPETFKYQALIRNDDGSALTNKEITLQIKIHKGSATGDILYSETHSATTSESGIAYINIGEGDSGNMRLGDLNWADDEYFMQVEINKGNGFVDLGTQQILSVPYAQFAKKAQQVVLTSPNGKQYKLEIDNNGTLSAKGIE